MIDPAARNQMDTTIGVNGNYVFDICGGQDQLRLPIITLRCEFRELTGSTKLRDLSYKL